MKKLRKFIVKYYVGYYKIGPGTVPRASVIIFPTLMITILLEIIFKSKPILWHYIPFFITASISFIYLWIWPASVEEMNEAQKKQYDDLIK